MTAARIKVSIRCKKCGERFVLRGKREKGQVDTGFRQCVCSNEQDFDVEVQD
jgi:formylmethanofuran dehydrogenase subunit E